MKRLAVVLILAAVLMAFPGMAADSNEPDDPLWEELKQFPWLTDERKPFLQEHLPGPDYAIYLCDLTLDGTPEIILRATHYPRAVPACEVLALVDGKLTSLGGFFGEPSENDIDELTLWRTRDSRLRWFQWTNSSYSGEDLSVCLAVTWNLGFRWNPGFDWNLWFHPLEYRPLVAVLGSYMEDTQPTYYRVEGAENCPNDFVANGIYTGEIPDGAVVEEITHEEYQALLDAEFDALTPAGSAPFRAVLYRNLWGHEDRREVLLEKYADPSQADWTDDQKWAEYLRRENELIAREIYAALTTPNWITEKEAPFTGR